MSATLLNTGQMGTTYNDYEMRINHCLVAEADTQKELDRLKADHHRLLAEITKERIEYKEEADESASQGIAYAERADKAEALITEWEFYHERYPPDDAEGVPESFKPWAVPGIESHDLPPGTKIFNMENHNPPSQYVTTSDAAETCRSQLPTTREDLFKAFGTNLPRLGVPGPQTGGPPGGTTARGPLNGALLGPVAQMQAAEAYKDGRNPYIHPMNVPSNSKNQLPSRDLSQEEINECLITGNPAHIAQLNQTHNYGVDHRIATLVWKAKRSW